MKKLFFVAFLWTIVFTSCNSQQQNETSATQTTSRKPDTLRAANTSSAAEKNESPAAVVFPVKAILAGYLQLKNALAKDNGKDAARAGNLLLSDLAKVDTNSLPKAQMKDYLDIAEDMKEHAQHIGSNAGKIEHQREHFILLSKDISDLVKTLGTGGETLYKDFCPMANEGKGAIWLSEVKEIKNPYLGAKMPTCGSVKETLK